MVPDLSSVPIFRALSKLGYFEKHFAPELEVLYSCGVHPTRKKEITDPFSGKPVLESFTNIGQHCMAVAFCAETLALALAKNELLSPREVRAITQMSLLHDASKFLEILRNRAIKAGIHCELAHPEERRDQEAEILLGLGINPEAVQKITVAARVTGRESLSMFLVTDETGLIGITAPLSARILQLADNMTSTNIPKNGDEAETYFLTNKERQIVSDFKNRYAFLQQRGLARRKSDGILIEVDYQTTIPDELLPLGYMNDMQLYISNQIAGELVNHLKEYRDEDPEVFIKDLVNRRVAAEL